MQDGGNVGRVLRLVQQSQSHALDFQRSYNLTGPQFSVLSAIVGNPGIDQRSVCEMTFVDKSTVADVVNRLVERRLLTARRNPVDGRHHCLVPARTAVAVLYEAMPQLIRRYDGFLAPLSPELRADFLRAVQIAGYADRTQPPSRYVVPSPDGIRPPLDVPWGLGRPLRACVQRYGRLWAAGVAEVTHVQWLALNALAARGELDQRSLGETISLDKASLTVMVERLNRRELLSKIRDPSDGRRRLLKLTRTGRRLVTSLASDVIRVDDAFLSPLDKEQLRRKFVAALAILATRRPGRADPAPV